MIRGFSKQNKLPSCLVSIPSTMTIELEDVELIMGVGEFQSRIRSKGSEYENDVSYIYPDSVLLGLPIKIAESNSGDPTVVFGVGVVENAFQNVN